jgi:hypothetical protein
MLILSSPEDQIQETSSGDPILKSIVRVAALAALIPILACKAQTPATTGTTAAKASAAPMQTFNAQDGSASAQLPAGWKIVNQGQTVIDATGPNGEDLSLGNTYIARNAPYTAGKVQGADLNIPYQDNLEQKFTLIFQHSAGLSGRALPTITFISATPVQAPAPFGQCALFLGTMTATGDTSGPFNFESAFCSLPMDVAGTYKNIFKYGQVPVRLAAQERASIEAALASYSIPMNWLQRKLALNVTAPSGIAGLASGAATIAQANAINAETMKMMEGADTSANCADQAIRETPLWKLPPACR